MDAAEPEDEDANSGVYPYSLSATLDCAADADADADDEDDADADLDSAAICALYNNEFLCLNDEQSTHQQIIALRRETSSHLPHGM